MGVWSLELSAQAMRLLFVWIPRCKKKMFEKRRWGLRGGHVGERERVCIGDPERLPVVGEGYENIITVPARVVEYGMPPQVRDEALHYRKKKECGNDPYLLFSFFFVSKYHTILSPSSTLLFTSPPELIPSFLAQLTRQSQKPA